MGGSSSQVFIPFAILFSCVVYFLSRLEDEKKYCYNVFLIPQHGPFKCSFLIIYFCPHRCHCTLTWNTHASHSELITPAPSSSTNQSYISKDGVQDPQESVLDLATCPYIFGYPWDLVAISSLCLGHMDKKLN